MTTDRAHPAPRPRLTIIGASVRSAAQSATRAGFDVTGFDLFADLDTRQVARVTKVDDLLKIRAGDLPANVPWIYTGALENHPGKLAEWRTAAPLFGAPPEQLKQVRDPDWLQSLARECGLNPLQLWTDPSQIPANRLALRKPLQSASGLGIRRASTADRKNERFYFQELAAGRALSAVLLASADSSKCELVGITESCMTDIPTGNPYVWTGCCGPLSISDEQRIAITRLGTELVRRAGVIGIFGLDLITSEERLSVLEVNPRYTASVEVVERFTGRSLLAETIPTPDCRLSTDAESVQFAAKMILWADDEVTFRLPVEIAPNQIRDIPSDGTLIEPGHPICTIHATGTTRETCVNSLRSIGGEALQSWGLHTDQLSRLDSLPM